jgi:hypothetical protein
MTLGFNRYPRNSISLAGMWFAPTTRTRGCTNPAVDHLSRLIFFVMLTVAQFHSSASRNNNGCESNRACGAVRWRYRWNSSLFFFQSRYFDVVFGFFIIFTVFVCILSSILFFCSHQCQICYRALWSRPLHRRTWTGRGGQGWIYCRYNIWIDFWLVRVVLRCICQYW